MKKAELNIDLSDDWVFIDPDFCDKESRTAGGIVLPDSAGRTKGMGQVYEKGPGKMNRDTGERDPIDCDPGDIVLYDMFGANEITYEGRRFYAIRATSIYGVISLPTS